MKLKEIIFLILDELKGFTGDFDYQEEHTIFLVNQYRSFLLKQRYANDIKKEIPESNYQQICLNLIPTLNNNICSKPMLKSIERIPDLLPFGSLIVSPVDYYSGINISYVNRERMRYVGNNKYIKNIIYCSKGPDGYLYFTSNNPQFKYLKKVKFTGIFEDVELAIKNSCIDTSTVNCDILDSEYPLESALVPPLIELVVKELSASIYRPEDGANNSTDDLSKVNVNNGR